MKLVHVAFWVFLSGAGFSAVTQAAETASAAVAYAEAELLLRELERIRQYMGVRPPRSSESRMKGAEARQVFYAAQNIYRKCSLLANQLTGVSRISPPIAPETGVSAADLVGILKLAREQVDVVESALEVTLPLPPARKVRKPDMSDAMLVVIDSDFLLNRLTGYQAAWPDIYDHLLQIITYLGGALPAEQRYPRLDPHVPAKMPQDIGLELFAARAASRAASREAGVAVIDATIVRAEEGGLSAEGVAYLTTTLRHDFAEITIRLGADDVDSPEYKRPARVLPSHVYQLAVALRKQAELLGARY